MNTMNRTTSIINILCVATAIAFGSSAAAAAPNIVLIVADDLGYTDLACFGSDYYETPNIDRLATQGMTFTNAYANAPNCAPTRACLMSGLYSPRHGVYTVGNADRGAAKDRKLLPVENKTELDGHFVTMAEMLKANGYTTAHMGKWHLGDDANTSPTAQGFDINIAGNHRGAPRSYFSPYRNPNLQNGPKGENLTDRMGDEASRFIIEHATNNKSQPFFLYLPFYAVHTPIQAKEDVAAKYKEKQPTRHHNNPEYAAMIETMDAAVGKVLATLDKQNLTDNTMVIFFSDNGGMGRVTSQWPLRGAKGMLYEGGIREPLIVRWPGKVQAGSTCNVPVIGIDFYPTFVDVIDATQSVPEQLDGISILPLLEGNDAIDREALHWHFPAYLEGRNYKGARGRVFRTTPCAAVRKGDWKLIEFFEDGELELYNLAEDIGESRNLAEKNPAKVRELHELSKAWRSETKAFVPTQLNPKYQPN